MKTRQKEKSFIRLSQHCDRNLQPQSQLHTTHFNLTSWNNYSVSQGSHPHKAPKKERESREGRKEKEKLELYKLPSGNKQ